MEHKIIVSSYNVPLANTYPLPPPPPGGTVAAIAVGVVVVLVLLMQSLTAGVIIGVVLGRRGQERKGETPTERENPKL